MKTPLNIGTKEIDASQIAAIRPNSEYDQDRMVAALGISKERAAQFTARITMLDNTTHNVEGLEVAQVVDALKGLGIRFTMIDKDNVAVRTGDPSIQVTYHPFGKNSDMPEEERRFFSEVRVGRNVKIWLTTRYEDLTGTSSKPAANLHALASASQPVRPGANGTGARPTTLER